MSLWKKALPLRQMPELDTIRLISILLVVLHHQFSKANAFFAWFTEFGWVGVDIFFVMSGFLITSLLLREREATGTISLQTFWKKRMLRLWPSWLFTLLLSICMVWFFGQNNPSLLEKLFSKWWHYFLHFGNYSILLEGNIHIVFNHFWSLAVEEHFYLLWPLVLFFVPGRRGIMAVGLLIIASSFGLRLWHLLSGHDVHLTEFATHTRLDELVMGCLLSVGWSRIKDLAPLSEMLLTALMACLFLGGLYFGKGNMAFPVLNALGYSFIGLSGCLLIVIALKGGRWGIRRVLRVPLFAKLGVLSYGVYLIHLHVSQVLYWALGKLGITPDPYVLATLNLVLPFGPAWIMYFYIDEVFAKFRHRRVSVPVVPQAG